MVKIVDTEEHEKSMLERLKDFSLASAGIISILVVLTTHPILSHSMLRKNASYHIQNSPALIVLVAFSFAYVQVLNIRDSILATVAFIIIRWGIKAPLKSVKTIKNKIKI